jgi:hypothetical protein
MAYTTTEAETILKTDIRKKSDILAKDNSGIILVIKSNTSVAINMGIRNFETTTKIVCKNNKKTGLIAKTENSPEPRSSDEVNSGDNTT